MRNWKGLLVAGTISLLAGTMYARADAQHTVKIGVLNDQSGPYADMGGLGSVVAANLAVEDSGLRAKGWTIDVLSADHQNKPDVGLSIARRWYDVDGVNMITDLTNSSIALAVSGLTREKNKVALVSGAATSDLTGKACSPNTIHWTDDTWSLAHATGEAAVHTGGTSWFFITADYAFGQALERDTATVVKASGGTIIGNVLVPFNASDFSSYLLQAQSSGAKIIGLANSGNDTVNSIKQAAEFDVGAHGDQHLVGLLLYLTDIHAIGLQTSKGLILASPFYWDLNAGTRSWSARFAAKMHGVEPTMVQAGVYSATLDYLKAVSALASAANGAAVVAKMKATPTDDPLFGHGYIRQDGRKIHPMYLFEVKTPAESKGPWDLYKLRAVIPADEAWRPLDQDHCPLVDATEHS
jgi:branched-chain amino acid transport system substrate-binding protein